MERDVYAAVVYSGIATNLKTTRFQQNQWYLCTKSWDLSKDKIEAQKTVYMLLSYVKIASPAISLMDLSLNILGAGGHTE